MYSIQKALTNLASKATLAVNSINNGLFNPTINNGFFMQKNFMATLLRMHQKHMEFLENPKVKKKVSVLDGKPFAKGIILKTLVKKPRKPNSANRKCVLVKLSTGKEMFSYVPGIGHNLQEHQVVLCRVGKLKDTPGVKIKCVRGKYDLPHVK